MMRRKFVLKGFERVCFSVVTIAYFGKTVYDFLFIKTFLFAERRKVGIIIPEFHIYNRKQ